MGFLARHSGSPGLLESLKSGASPSAQVGIGGSSFWGNSSLSGEYVNPQIAMQLSAVWSACNILGQTLGSLPCNMCQHDKDFAIKLPKHPLQFPLNLEPNPEMGAMDWRMSGTANLALWGNAYSKIVRLRSGRIAGLWPLPTQLVKFQRNGSTNAPEYVYYPVNGGREVYSAKEILHLRTLSWDGIQGISPVRQLRNSFGLALALERYGSRFFANGGVPGIILEHPGSLSDEAKRNIRDSWRGLYGGADNAHGVAITEEGMKATLLSNDPQKAQAVESRAFQILEVARIWRIPPHMLAELSKASYASIEQQSLEFVTYTLLPWFKVWESAIGRSLLDAEEKGKVFAAFDPSQLLRGDIRTRYAAYAVGRQWGWLSVNKILAMEGMPGVGPSGDVLLEPLNMVEIGASRDDEQGGHNEPKPGAPPIPPKPAAFGPRKMLSFEEYMNQWKEAA